MIISNNLTPTKWAHQRFQWLRQRIFFAQCHGFPRLVALTKPQDKSSSRLAEVRDQQDNSIHWIGSTEFTGNHRNPHDFHGKIDGFRLKCSLKPIQ